VEMLRLLDTFWYTPSVSCNNTFRPRTTIRTGVPPKEEAPQRITTTWRTRGTGPPSKKRITEAMKKLIGLVAALAVLGAVLASFASAEEVPSQPPPAATEESEPAPPAATEESEPASVEGVCGVGNICVYVFPFFEGPSGITSCQAPGAHPLGGNRSSIQNECVNVAVWMRVNGNAVGCKNPGTSNNSITFNELWVGAD